MSKFGIQTPKVQRSKSEQLITGPLDQLFNLGQSCLGMPDQNWQAPLNRHPKNMQPAAFSHKAKVNFVSLKTGDLQSKTEGWQP
jgi:hypothetical protein